MAANAAPSRVDWCSSPSRGSPSRGAPTVLIQNDALVSTSTNLAAIGANIRSCRDNDLRLVAPVKWPHAAAHTQAGIADALATIFHA